jgi:hypothetical protein
MVARLSLVNGQAPVFMEPTVVSRPTTIFAHLYVGPDGKVIAEMRDLNIVIKNGFQLGHGMLDYWNKFDLPGVPHPLGLPLSNEKDWTSPDGKKFVVQVFERAVLGYDGSIADPTYRVQGLLIGYDWGKQKGLVS